MENQITRKSLNILFLLFILLGFLLVYYTGPIINNRFAHDVPCALEGGWRVLQGQIPNTDFFCTYGPFFSYIVAFGMCLSGLSVKSLCTANIFLFILLSIWCFTIGIKRLTIFSTFIISIITGLFCIGCYHLGFDYYATTYANLYNRYSYAMLFILLIEQFFEPFDNNYNKRNDAVFGGLTSGILLTVLFFTKLNFFVVASAFIIIRIFSFGLKKEWLIPFICGCLLIFIPISIALKFNVLDSIFNFSMAVQVRRNGVANSLFLYDKISPHIPSIIIFICLLLFQKLFCPQNNLDWRKRIGSLLLIPCIIFSSIFLNITNYGITDMPLLIMGSLLPMEIILKNSSSIDKKIKNRVILVTLLLFVGISGLFIFKNTASVLYSAVDKFANLKNIDKIASNTLGDFFVRFADGHGNGQYAKKINDGLELLRKNITEKDRIECIKFDNPFSFGLMQLTPKGGYLGYHYNNNFNEKIHIQPEKLFSEPTLIMIPKQHDPESTTPAIMIYGQYLKKHFNKTAESAYWLLLKKNNNPGNSSP